MDVLERDGKKLSGTSANQDKISKDIFHAEGVGGRIIVFRLNPGIDMIEGLKQVCRHYGIKAGVISSILGSLEKVKLLVPHKGPTFSVSKNHKPSSIIKKNVNVASGCGLISTVENGEIEIDLHMMVFDGGLSDMPAVGGHVDFNAPAPVRRTLEGAIEEIKGINLIRKVDKNTGVTVTFPIKE